ncbi:hypothetical protein ACGFRG_07140 [Streptomyces sp. NPDC048696]|uniref:hypothetical protein n=1 Tax=Streptomyces sp. NPDC048696 TaxID=3365585 RepID=UPI003715A61F
MVVDPAHTWFDGVSGGRLWRNGREVERRPAQPAPNRTPPRRTAPQTAQKQAAR